MHQFLQRRTRGTLGVGALMVGAHATTSPSRIFADVSMGSQPSDKELDVRQVKLVLAGTAMLVGMAVPAFASAPPTLSASDHVTICHATGSAKHPYVRISPSVAGVVNGHLKHQDHRDVVPPFVYAGNVYSQNWTSGGQVFLAGGCVGTFTPGSGGSGGGPL